ncbi:hypothetical protein NIES25_30240 [Nostoc linckia NIES-25]|nr:hypothetical protein NIES25_30240 [Nostoc linckia NIES-25]
MKNSSKSLQQLHEASFNMPNGLISRNLNAENQLYKWVIPSQKEFNFDRTAISEW